jgi:hypothetical protein
MNTLTIDRTSDTPAVELDPQKKLMELVGNSYPENAIEFYQPIYDWVHSYFAGASPSLTAVLKLNYFNTSSAKCILNLLTILQNYHAQNRPVNVQWYYDEEDEDMLETGRAFSVDFNMPFDFHSYTA